MRLGFFTAISRFSVSVGSLSGLATGLMMLVILADVIGRWLFAAPLPLATEISVMLLILKIFLGMAGAQATDSNFQVTFAVDALSPRWRRRQRIMSLTISLAAVSVIAWLSIDSAIISTAQGETSFGVHTWPIWPERIALAAGLALLAVQILSDLIATTVWGHDAIQSSLPRHSGAL